MEIVDIGITKFWIWGPKSRSVNNSSQRSDFGLLDLFSDSLGIQGDDGVIGAEGGGACHIVRVDGMTPFLRCSNCEEGRWT
jgi:hypothetical protein